MSSHVFLALPSPVWRVVVTQWNMCGCYVSACPRYITLQGLLLWGTDSNLWVFNRAVVNVFNSFEFRVVWKHPADLRAFCECHRLKQGKITLCIKLLKQNKQQRHSTTWIGAAEITDCKVTPCRVFMTINSNSSNYQGWAAGKSYTLRNSLTKPLKVELGSWACCAQAQHLSVPLLRYHTLQTCFILSAFLSEHREVENSTFVPFRGRW